MAQKNAGRPQKKSPKGKPVEMQPVSSSNLAAVGYVARQKWLYVRFRDGSTYVYYSVPKDEFVGLISAGSKGKYLHYSIMDEYSYDRIG